MARRLRLLLLLLLIEHDYTLSLYDTHSSMLMNIAALNT
jgi:hypothetical protein